MKLFCIVAILLLSGFSTIQAQDLIVTAKGDSLNCRITRVRKDYIHFTFKYEQEIRSTLLPVNQVTYYKEDYFTYTIVPASAVKRNSDYQKFRVALHGGWSYRTAKLADNIPADFRSYFKGLKSGAHFGADAGFFFSENIGVGLKYLYFHAGNELDNVRVTDQSGQTKTGLMKDDINIHYIAPAFYTRLYTANKKAAFLAGFSLGYLRYVDNAVLVDNFTLTSGTLGVGIDLGMDFMLNRHLALGAGVGLLAGTLTTLQKDDGISRQTIELEDGERESLARLDLSIGLRWYW